MFLEQSFEKLTIPLKTEDAASIIKILSDLAESLKEKDACNDPVGPVGVCQKNMRMCSISFDR